jgi:hypothetical protein
VSVCVSVCVSVSVFVWVDGCVWVCMGAIQYKYIHKKA